MPIKHSWRSEAKPESQVRGSKGHTQTHLQPTPDKDSSVLQLPGEAGRPQQASHSTRVPGYTAPDQGSPPTRAARPVGQGEEVAELVGKCRAQHSQQRTQKLSEVLTEEPGYKRAISVGSVRG